MEKPGKISNDDSFPIPRMSAWRRKKVQLEKELDLHIKKMPSNEFWACSICFTTNGVHYTHCQSEIPF